MCNGCRHLNKCLEIVVPAEIVIRALEEHEMFCPAEYPELLQILQQLKGVEDG